MEAAELFDRFYQEQINDGTADGSIWEYKDDIEKLMVDYHNAQMEPIREHIKKIVDSNIKHEIFFLERSINEEKVEHDVDLSGMETIEIKALIEKTYPEFITWEVYHLVTLDSILNHK